MIAAFRSVAVMAVFLAFVAGCDKTDSTVGQDPAATAGAKTVGVSGGPQKDKAKSPPPPPIAPPKKP
jgi:hypothetical protein